MSEDPRKIKKIVESAITIRDAKRHMKSFWNVLFHPKALSLKDWFRFKKLSKNLVEVIKKLKDDVWDIEYMKNLQVPIVVYYDSIEPYIHNRFSINDRSMETIDMFKNMIFNDTEGRNMIIVSVVSDTIGVDVFWAPAGTVARLVTKGVESKEQAKPLAVCKQKIIDMLLDVVNDNVVGDSQEMVKNLLGDHHTDRSSI